MAGWFNVGVQVFCVFRVLYGKADKKETTEFYKTRFIKILVPYYIVFLLFAVVEFLFFRKFLIF